MILKIEKDHQRFRQIVKGRIREDLRKFLTKGELIGKEGKHLISIPLRGVDLPHFRYGDNSQGVGAGDGKEGDVVGKGQPGQGRGQGGTESGQHLMEVDLTLDELAEILAEELKLPRIDPKGRHRITTVRDRYSSLRRVGPESLRHFKRSFKEVDKHTCYHLREDGGTKISSAFKCAKQLLDAHYSPDEWNIYLFHFSDGDNSSEADSRECVKMLKEQLLPTCNMFGYCQVASAYGSGNFINVLHEHLRHHEKVLTSRVNSKDDIYDSIKTFFGKGH